MIMTGYIGKERKRLLNHKTDHSFIFLKEKGAKIAENFDISLTEQEIASVKDVAEKLRDLNITNNDLLNKYCQEWMQGAIKNLEIHLT